MVVKRIMKHAHFAQIAETMGLFTEKECVKTRRSSEKIYSGIQPEEDKLVDEFSGKNTAIKKP
jgi:hypothetical protein